MKDKDLKYIPKTYEQFILEEHQNRAVADSYTAELDTYSDMSVQRGYGPCLTYNSECRCSLEELQRQRIILENREIEERTRRVRREESANRELTVGKEGEVLGLIKAYLNRLESKGLYWESNENVIIRSVIGMWEEANSSLEEKIRKTRKEKESFWYDEWWSNIEPALEEIEQIIKPIVNTKSLFDLVENRKKELESKSSYFLWKHFDIKRKIKSPEDFLSELEKLEECFNKLELFNTYHFLENLIDDKLNEREREKNGFVFTISEIFFDSLTNKIIFETPISVKGRDGRVGMFFSEKGIGDIRWGERRGQHGDGVLVSDWDRKKDLLKPRKRLRLIPITARITSKNKSYYNNSISKEENEKYITVWGGDIELREERSND